MSYTGKGNSANDVWTWDGVKQLWVPPSGGAAFGSMATANMAECWNQINSGGVNEGAAARLISPSSFTATRMRCFVDQDVGSPAGNIQMAIYNSSGNILSTTGAPVPLVSAGIISLPLATPVPISGGVQYFLGLYNNSNLPQFWQLAKTGVGRSAQKGSGMANAGGLVNFTVGSFNTNTVFWLNALS